LKIKIVGIIICTLLITTSISLNAVADWNPGDDYKMHFPQLPNPFGWDVDATRVEQVWPQICLADDWMCTETGPVTDIHFWGSWFNDNIGIIQAFVIAIHADIPANPPQIPYSRPGVTIWERTFVPNDWKVAGPWEGPQGWYNSGEGFFIPQNHILYWQYNIENIPNPFVQTQGTIYWLSISAIVMPSMPPQPQPRWGWKSSLNHWNDDAVWAFWNELNWGELHEPPDFQISLDLAFVITGEEINHPPNTPSKPSGPTTGIVGTVYTYTTSTTDPDGDNVRYGWDAGDGVVDFWTENYSSGATCTVNIKFLGAGTYYLQVKAKDIHGAQSNFSQQLTVVITGANNPPNTPSKPTGPTSGIKGTSYTYSTSTNDLDGDKIKYGWDWNGDGTVDEWTSLYASGATVSNSHTFSNTGIFNMKVIAEDEHGAQSSFSSALPVTITSNPPNKPSKPRGSASGKPGVSYTYQTSTTDPDGDQLYYMWDWGDRTPLNWTGPYNSGQTITASHIWSAKGAYSVKVKAKDTTGAESVWSDPLPITMPYSFNKPILQFLELLFQRFPNAFPILRQLLGY